MKNTDPKFTEEIQAFFQRAGSKADAFKAFIADTIGTFQPVELPDDGARLILAPYAPTIPARIILSAYNPRELAFIVVPTTTNPREDWDAHFSIDTPARVILAVAHAALA